MNHCPTTYLPLPPSFLAFYLLVAYYSTPEVALYLISANSLGLPSARCIAFVCWILSGCAKTIYLAASGALCGTCLVLFGCAGPLQTSNYLGIFGTKAACCERQTTPLSRDYIVIGSPGKPDCCLTLERLVKLSLQIWGVDMNGPYNSPDSQHHKQTQHRSEQAITSCRRGWRGDLSHDDPFPPNEASDIPNHTLNLHRSTAPQPSA